VKPLSVAVITPKLKRRISTSEEDFFTTPDDYDEEEGVDDDFEKSQGATPPPSESEVKDVVAGLIQKLEGPEVKWTCAACNMEGRDETELRRHIEAAHVESKNPKPEFTCTVCSKHFKSDKLLSKHMVVKHATVWERDISAEWGEGEADIQRLPHGGFMCLKCNKVFSRRYAAKSHLDIAHSTADPSLARSPCHVCSMVCKNRPALIKHLHRTHNLGAKYARPRE